MSTFDQYVPGRFTQPLAAAQAEHARGQRVIGYIGDDVPVELILAANALPVRIEVIVGQVTPLADRYLESSFGPAYRSYLEQWLRGDFNFLDAIVFPRSNDSAQRLYYYVCELQRRGHCKGPRPLIYDVARITRATSRAHTHAATEALARDLAVKTQRLEGVLNRMHQRLAFARRLNAMRQGSSAIAGGDVMQAWRALQLDWTEQFEHTVREWSSVATRHIYTKRFVLAGSTPADDRLHRAIEAADANFVDECTDGAIWQSMSRWQRSGPTIEGIANAYGDSRAIAHEWREAPEALVARVRAAEAHGVVLWLVEEDEGIVWEVPRQLEHLHRANIPVLTLTRQAWDADAAVLARITQFAREVAP